MKSKPTGLRHQKKVDAVELLFAYKANTPPHYRILVIRKTCEDRLIKETAKTFVFERKVTEVKVLNAEESGLTEKDTAELEEWLYKIAAGDKSAVGNPPEWVSRTEDFMNKLESEGETHD